MARSQFEVNTLGCWTMSKVFMPYLMTSRGRLVNMISFCTECPLPTLSLYTASKAALLSLSDGMRMELKKYGVDVILFNPGDYPDKTPLCSGQVVHYDNMFSDVNKMFGIKHPKVIKDFQAYQEKYATIFPEAGRLRKLDSPGLYKNFDKIIGDEKPKLHYVNSDWKTRSFFRFLNMIPKTWSDKARIAIMKLPK